MKALIDLQKLGYHLSREGKNLRFLWKGVGQPDSSIVRPLLEEIRANKEKALQYLEKKACDEEKQWDVEGMSNMTIDEFKRSPLAVRVWSQSLNREIWLVSSERAIREIAIEGIYFTTEELEYLLRLKPEAKDLETVVDIKEIFGGKLIAFSEKNQ